MSNNVLRARTIHIHDVEARWNQATQFIPKQGELVVYDIDNTHSYQRFKIGDGVTPVVELPFAVDAALKQFFTYQDEIVYIDGGRITDYE